MRRPPLQQAEDVTLHISVLLANGAIQEAFTFQRSRRGSVSSASLLSSFYRTAEELGKLDSVLQLSLSQAEEREFVSFLESASKAHAREVLLMYYLQRARFSEAMQLNQQMAEAGMGGTARQAIMARYSHILPSFASTLGTRRLALAPSTKQEKPVPLSVALQDRNIKLQSHATLIEQRLHTPKRDGNANANIFTPFRKKKAGGLSVSGLLRPTDVTTSSKRPRIGDAEKSLIGFPQESTVMDDSRLQDADEGAITPPTKRTRLCDVSSLNMSVKSMKRMSVYRTADALTILSTPTLTRRERTRPLSPRRPPSTPQSILKVKQLIKDSATRTTVGEKPFLDVSLNLEDTGSLTPRSREGTPGKSLRFKEPRKLPPPGTPPPPPALEGAMIVAEEQKAEVSALSNESQESFHSVEGEGEEPMEGVEESHQEISVEEEREVLVVEVDEEEESVAAPVGRRPMARQTSTAAKIDEIVARGSRSLREKENEARERAEKAAKEVQAQEEERRRKSDRQVKSSEVEEEVVLLCDDEEEGDDVDEDEEYYANRSWQKRECDIVVTLNDEENKEDNDIGEEVEEKENEEEVVDIDSTGEDSPEGKKVLDYSWAPSRLQGRKSTVQQIMQEEEEEENTEPSVVEEQDKSRVDSEEMEAEKKTMVRTSLDTTASTPSFYEPVNFSWEEQQEGKSSKKTTEEILKMIEDEEDDEEEEEHEVGEQKEEEDDVINLDSDEDEQEAAAEKPAEKQVVATQVLFSSLGRLEGTDGQSEKSEVKTQAEEVVGISDEEETEDEGAEAAVVVEDEGVPSVETNKIASSPLLLFSTFGAAQREEELLDPADGGGEVEFKISGGNDQDEQVLSNEETEEEMNVVEEGFSAEEGMADDRDALADVEEAHVDVDAVVDDEEEALEVLDAVSTAATRASSIAGSVLGEQLPPSVLAGEVLFEDDDGVKDVQTGLPSIPVVDPIPTALTTFAFSEPTGAATDSDEEQVFVAFTLNTIIYACALLFMF